MLSKKISTKLKQPEHVGRNESGAAFKFRISKIIDILVPEYIFGGAFFPGSK